MISKRVVDAKYMAEPELSCILLPSMLYAVIGSATMIKINIAINILLILAMDILYLIFLWFIILGIVKGKGGVVILCVF